MIWLNPLAIVALVGILAPIAIHFFVHCKAPRLPFPTLRFIQPARLTAIRRRALDDAGLLAVRAAILAAAAGAVAGPVLVTPGRERQWDTRVVRAEVVARGTPPSGTAGATFVVDRFDEGIARAIAWLDRQPPSRRELMVRSPFPIGALTASDLASVPSGVGIRLERAPASQARRVAAAAPVVALSDPRQPESSTLAVVSREMALAGDRTSVRDVTTTPIGRSAVEIVAAREEQGTADGVLRTVLSERVRAWLPNRAARVVLAASGDASAGGGAAAIRTAWIADAAARIAHDLAARGMDDRGLRFAESDGRLVVIDDAHPSSPLVPALLRSVFESLAAPLEQPAAEILSIPDERLRAWARAPGPAAPPRPDTIDRDDRRWLWGAALLLLAIESRMRRARRGRRADLVPPLETSRVA